jgi:predicted MFS family arabinose efflux permease
VPSDSSAAKGYLPLLCGLSFAVFLTVTAIAMFGPLLIDMSSALGTTVPVAGQLVTTAGATWALTAIVVGPFSDAYGRKPVLVLGTCILATGSLGLGLAPSFAVATGFSALIGVGGGMVPPTCIALVGDIFPDTRKPMSIAVITAAPGMSSVLGVPIAAVLADVAGWRAPFLTLGVALALAGVLLFFLVPYHRPRAVQLDLVGRLRWAVSLPVTWHIAGTNILARIAWGVVITFFPAFLIVTYGLGTAQVALPIAVVALGATAAPLLGGTIGRTRRRLLVTAALLLAASIPGLAVFLLGWGVWFSVIAASLFMLLVVPVTTILSIVFAQTGGTSRGTLAGIISTTNWAGTAVGAAAGGVLVAHAGYGALSWLLVAVILGSGLAMAFLVNDGAVARAREHFSSSPTGGS